MARRFAVVVSILVFAGVLVGCGSGTTAAVGSNTSTSTAAPTFNDPVTLANSIETTANQHLANPADPKYQPGVTITDVTCIHTAATNFECNDTASDGTTGSVSVTVAADGNTWISH